MHLDPIMPVAVGVLLIVMSIGLLTRSLRQPSVIAYLLAGVLIGPGGIGLIADAEVISKLGALGVVLLLFFVGMEASPVELSARWRLSLLATLAQVLLSVALVSSLGWWLDWPLSRVVLIGFVISLSSTAVVLKILQDQGELASPVGRDVTAILLAQDLAVIPMLLILTWLSGETPSPQTLALQALGVCLVGAVLYRVFREGPVHLPLSRLLAPDREMQVFAALTVCFGLALLTGLLGLSTALGAFVAGLLITAARETHWVQDSLNPLKVVFVALFFLSVGLLIDVEFLRREWAMALLLLLAALVVNTLINAAILRAAGRSWRDSLKGGGLLSQIGEFSFVLAAVGAQAGMISHYGYQLSLAVIALSLLASPVWIRLMHALAALMPAERDRH